jgi:hypothetical protein
VPRRGGYSSQPLKETAVVNPHWTAWALRALAAAVLLLPIWGFPYFLTEDGPTHVENAKILLDYGKPAHELLRTFYTLNLKPYPNWASHLALAALMSVTGPWLAEKLLLSAYVLLVPVAFRYALLAVRPAAAPLWPLILPFVYPHFFHRGFYNLAFAAIPFFFILGRWMRNDGRLRLPGSLALSALLVLLYFCHLVTLLLALASLGLLALWISGRELAANGRAAARGVAVRLATLTAASAPAAVLVLRFVSSQGTERAFPGPTLGERWRDLWRLYELASHTPRELWLTSALGVVLLVAAAFVLAARVRARRAERSDGFLLAAMAVAAVYFLAPVTVLHSPGSTAGGGTIHDRVAPYVYMVLLLFIAGYEMREPVRRALSGVGLAAAMGLLLVRWPHYAEMNTQLAEYLQSAPHIERHRTLLPLSFAHNGRRADGSLLSWRTSVFLHAGAWLAIERDLVDFANYEADLGYFPTLFRPEANPYRLLRGGQELLTPCVSFRRYERHGPRPLDYILLWGAPPSREDPCLTALFRHLESDYERVHVSRPQGLARLYRRRDAASPAR